MRRITLLLAAILTVCSLNAQKGNKNEKVVNIDKVNYRITYNGKMVPDTQQFPTTIGRAKCDWTSVARQLISMIEPSKYPILSWMNKLRRGNMT